MKKNAKKLNLGKKTISNLSDKEMNRKVGGISKGFCLPPKKAAQPK